MAKRTNSIININKTVDRKAIFAKAWEIARKGQEKFGGKVSEYFAASLREAWEWAKKAIRILLPKWFMDKNNNFESTHCRCVASFGLADIAKETEKAIMVKLPMITKTGQHTKFAKAVWIPKAILG
jgi:hypothetical protein